MKQLSMVDKSELRYWLKEYIEKENEVQLYFNIQSKELCAVLVLDVEQWNKLEQIRKTKGKGRFNAEFTNLTYKIVQDPINPKFVYNDYDRILD